MTHAARILEPALEMLSVGDPQAAYKYLKPLADVGLESAKPFVERLASEPSVTTSEVMPQGDQPPVTWSEVSEHLIRRLYIDEQWMVQEDGRLTWWPWFLEQSFSLTHAGYFGGDQAVDPWLTVTANIDIARVPEDMGVEFASEVNSTFPLGALVYDGQVLSMRGTLTLSSLNRNMLRLFHESVLAQATVAHEVAVFLQERGFEVCESQHPINGVRQAADELLGFFATSGRDVPPGPDLLEKIHAARPRYLEELVNLGGLTLGWSNDEVDFVTLREEPLLDVAIALPTDDADNARYGTGIRLIVRMLPPGRQFGPEALNYVNLDLLNYGGLTMLGNVRTDELSEQWGSYYCTYLTSGALEEASNIDDRALPVEVLNAVLHSMGPARVLQDVFLREAGSDPQAGQEGR